MLDQSSQGQSSAVTDPCVGPLPFPSPSIVLLVRCLERTSLDTLDWKFNFYPRSLDSHLGHTLEGWASGRGTHRPECKFPWPFGKKLQCPGYLKNNLDEKTQSLENSRQRVHQIWWLRAEISPDWSGVAPRKSPLAGVSANLNPQVQS